MRIKDLVRLLAALASCVALWGPALVCAQKTPVEHEAKAEFEAGVRASSAQDYAVAREHFMRSRQLVLKASTLLNLAIVDLKLGLFDEALIALDAIDAPAPGPEQERLRQRARKMRGDIALLRESVVRARDQQQGDSDVAQRELKPAAAAPPDDSAAPAPPDAPAPPVTAPRAQEPLLASTTNTERAPTPSELPSLRGARTLLALGGALALSTLGSSLWWYDRRSDYRTCHREEGTCPEKNAIENERTAAAAVTIGLGVVSAGLIVGGAIWLVKRKESRASVSLTGDRRSLGLIAHVRF